MRVVQERNIMFSSEKAIEPVFGASQCQICGVALSGPVSFIFRLAGIRRSPRNPNVCSRCNSHIENGNISEITVLFADLSSFTELTQRLGPEKTHEVVDAFLKMATEILKRQGATIDKYMGDAVMAWFNVPVPQIDHAKRAVQSAIEMQACMPLLEKEYGVKLQISVGISSGWAFVGPVGSKGYSDFTAIGDSVNLAARLEQQAKPGEIILSESVYMGAKEILQNVWQETLNLKGFPDPICVYRIKKKRCRGS
jgi:adenylate cyclase